MIVQIGCGTVCAAVFKGAQVGLWQIAAVWSIAVTLAISCTAAISGAHLNPAITLAFAAVRDFEWKKVIPFIIAQVFGAVAAGGVNFALFRDSIAGFEKINGIVRGAAIASNLHLRLGNTGAYRIGELRFWHRLTELQFWRL